MIGGSKGGVGKSIVTLALVDYIFDKKEKISVIETDTSNPDVYKTFSKEKDIDTLLVDLDKADGWIELVNTCDEKNDHTIIINTAARNNSGIEKYGDTLKSTLPELNRTLVTLWILNRQRDSLELLRSFLNTFSADNARIHVIRNNYFGMEEKFELYNGSATRKIIEDKGGKSLNFPDLADRVADDLYSKRLSISLALKELPLGNRAELKRWKGMVAKMFGEIIELV
jgi:hypothetical protein